MCPLVRFQDRTPSPGFLYGKQVWQSTLCWYRISSASSAQIKALDSSRRRCIELIFVLLCFDIPKTVIDSLLTHNLFKIKKLSTVTLVEATRSLWWRLPRIPRSLWWRILYKTYSLSYTASPTSVDLVDNRFADCPTTPQETIIQLDLFLLFFRQYP